MPQVEFAGASERVGVGVVQCLLVEVAGIGPRADVDVAERRAGQLEAAAAAVKLAEILGFVPGNRITSAGRSYGYCGRRLGCWRRNRWLLPGETRADTDPSSQADISETRKAVRTALSRLPERDTRLLLLREMGLSYAELATALEDHGRRP